MTESHSDRKVVSITEAAELNQVTRQAIYVAIKQRKLRAHKATTRWEIDVKDLEEYRKNRYCRSKSTFEGELLYDNTKGYYSVGQAAMLLNVPAQKIYYALRIGMIQGSRRGAAWVLHKDELKNYYDLFVNQISASDTAGVVAS